MARIKTYGIDVDISGADKVIGTDGDAGVNFGKTKNYTVAALAGYIGSGIQGPAGAQGPSGATGAAGADGSDGAQGVPGNAGAAGADGSDGTNGDPGATGSTGPAGSTGSTGSQGAAGADGTSINILGTVANCAALPTTGNTTGDLYILDAADGTCSGGAGAEGDGYVWTAGNTWLNIGPLRGPQGIQGVAGSQGLQGSIGAAGADGNDGDNGSNGDNGAQGTQGVQGIKGDTGSQGAVGSQGIQGIQGIQGLQGATGPVESVSAGLNITAGPATTGNVIIAAPNVVANNQDIWGTSKIKQIVTITQAQYDQGLGTNAEWLTIIVG